MPAHRAPAGPSARYRWGVASRTAAAVVGGYAVAALAAVAVGTLLPGTRATAAVTATLTALLVIPAAAMACFWTRSAARAWAIMLAACALLAGAALAGGWRP